MNLYIGDLHFGHKNAITFDHRPFASVEEMDAALIQLWNTRVSADDNVYILGDFCYRSGRTPDWYLKRLKGHKHLVIGNHDKAILDSENAMKYLESMDKMMYVTDNGKEICLCHFPLAEWNGSRHGSWHIYAHIHGSTDDVYQYMKTKECALNAGACINNYTPSSFNELVRNNKYFRERNDRCTITMALSDLEGEKPIENGWSW